MDKNVYHLKLISTGGAVTCDCHCLDGHSIWMTRERLGTALGFSNPGRAIAKYHARHRDVIEPLTIKVPLKKPSGGEQETYLYSDEAIMEICRWSKQPKADQFIDFVWDVMDKLIKGDLALLPSSAAAATDLIKINQQMVEFQKYLTGVNEKLAAMEQEQRALKLNLQIWTPG